MVLKTPIVNVPLIWICPSRDKSPLSRNLYKLKRRGVDNSYKAHGKGRILSATDKSTELSRTHPTQSVVLSSDRDLQLIRKYVGLSATLGGRASDTMLLYDTRAGPHRLEEGRGASALPKEQRKWKNAENGGMAGPANSTPHLAGAGPGGRRRTEVDE